MGNVLHRGHAYKWEDHTAVRGYLFSSLNSCSSNTLRDAASAPMQPRIIAFCSLMTNPPTNRDVCERTQILGFIETEKNPATGWRRVETKTQPARLAKHHHIHLAANQWIISPQHSSTGSVAGTTAVVHSVVYVVDIGKFKSYSSSMLWFPRGYPLLDNPTRSSIE